ncbi:MAG: hypothetical protein FJZ16_01185 [Candidatus Omnitrophica bacterium]|nr:hypothetical protein [Candidatus Omnitrophota bacterium]
MFNLLKKNIKSAYAESINEVLDGSKVNDVVSDLSYALIDDRGMDSEVPFKKQLGINKLNYSLESLKIVDQYLNYVRANKNTLKKEEFISVVARCGAYCGEVIRRNSKQHWEWITDNKAVELDQRLGEYAIYGFVLYETLTKTFTFPLAKVVKFLEGGAGDDLYSFAYVLINRNKK